MKKLIIYCCILLSVSFGVSAQEIEDGYRTFYYESGKVSSEGLIKNGKPEGYWRNYYITGILKSEGKRKNGLLDSIWVFYNEKGDTSLKISYVNGAKNGYYTKFGKNEVTNRYFVLSKELYFNDVLEGRSYYYDVSGEIKKISYYSNGKKENKEFEYGQENRIITVNNYIKGRLIEIERINRFDEKGRKDGLWREYYENFRIRNESNYQHGILNGIYKEFDKNGNLKLSLYYENGSIKEGVTDDDDKIIQKDEFYQSGNVKFTGSYLNNKPIGIHRYYDEEGVVTRSEEYNSDGVLIGKGVVDLEGFRDGMWTNFYETGEVKSKGSYTDGKKDGIWEFFYKSGKIEQKGNFKDDKYNGSWFWYNEDGKIIREENFYQGKNDGVYIEYNPSGNIITKGEYIEGERDGEWMIDIGDIKEEGRYTIGLKDGEWVATYKNGNKRFEGSYIQGSPDGMHILYYDNGVVEEERFYNSGSKEKVWKKYDRSGNLKVTIAYKNDSEIRINGIKIEKIEQDTEKLE